MAVFFTLLSMLSTCGSDLFEKKSVTSRTEEALKTLVWFGIFNIIIGVLVFLVATDETTLMPHELISQKPAVLLSPGLNYLCLFFALIAYKYVGVAVRNTFANIDGLFFIIVLVLYHLVTDNAQFATRLFDPLTLVGLILVIGAGFIYPNVRGPQDNSSLQKTEPADSTPKRLVVLGMVLAMVAAFFDGTQSVVDSVILGDEVADSVDYILTLAAAQVVIAFFIWIYLWIVNKKPYNPFRKSEKYRCSGQFLGALSDLFYILAVSDDALLGVILWNAFPILDILAARILMKEKLSFRQYAVLIAMILGATFVSLS